MGFIRACARLTKSPSSMFKSFNLRAGATVAVAASALVFTACSTTTEITTPNTETTYLSAPEVHEIEFQKIFDGRSLAGWKLLGQKGAGFGVTNGTIYCAHGGGGMLLTEKEYANFILRFDFRLSEGANNGVAIRAPFAARALAYEGMELQILDDTGDVANVERRPTQYHGSIYDVIPAKRGALRPAGEWNTQEVYARDRSIRVTVNGQVILDADLNAIRDPETLKKHPGLFKESGHLGFMGHKDFVEFRNIRVKELPRARVYNSAERDFDMLFNGSDLTGWRGAFDASKQVAAPQEKAQEINQQISDLSMATHWTVGDNALTHDGASGGVLSDLNYGNVELQVDYKLAGGSSGGVLLRGLPKVLIQHRDTPGNDLRLGSGGLHDGRFLYRAASAYADRFAGTWNRLRVILVEDRAHVYVNDRLVVKNAQFKNPDRPGEPLPARGPIGLANGNGQMSFRSIYARGIDAPPTITPRPKRKPALIAEKQEAEPKIEKIEPKPAPAPVDPDPAPTEKKIGEMKLKQD